MINRAECLIDIHLIVDRKVNLTYKISMYDSKDDTPVSANLTNFKRDCLKGQIINLSVKPLPSTVLTNYIEKVTRHSYVMLAIMMLSCYSLHLYFGKLRAVWSERIDNPQQEGQHLASFAYSCSFVALGNLFITNMVIEQMMESLIILVLFAVNALLVILI